MKHPNPKERDDTVGVCLMVLALVAAAFVIGAVVGAVAGIAGVMAQ